jgi:branched-chain amino acid aminotransferase
VNRDNCITEGSRTNIFFIRENRLFTAPDKLILSGITRKHILELCRENNIEVRYECVKANETDQYESAFMTGTSPVVLPFSSINDVKYRVDHPFIGMLRELYLTKAEESMKIFSIFDAIH